MPTAILRKTAAVAALLVFGCTTVSLGAEPTAKSSSAKISWLRSDTEAFAVAKTQHRFVLLYLEAVWCHWCHVMDEKTYADPSVQREIAAHFVPLRIDQDLRPDLSERYKDYGWPATIIFAADGSEIVKRQGYVEAPRFARLLKAIQADPSPESAANADTGPQIANGTLDEKTRAVLVARHHDTFDTALGGLTTGQKFLDRDSVEYEISRANAGDVTTAPMARKTLDAARALFDPTWGGVYQYSTMGDWMHPHFEKLATVQAQYLRIYALAWAAFHDPRDRQAVVEIRRYVDSFLRDDDGAFYTSQDADLHPGEHSSEYFALGDAARRKQGVPRVDKHLYTAQNGQLIEALATWAELGGDGDALAEAQAAARWVIAHRSIPSGGFTHDETDAAGPFMSDNLAMARAFLALYRASADRAWLTHANAALDFIGNSFATPHGYVSAKSDGPIGASAQIAENITLARAANLVARYSGNARHKDIADTALKYLADPKIALSEITEPGILLADDENHAEPLHLTVMGAKSDPAARVLFTTVQQLAPWYKRVEWWDKAEGVLPNPDVNYPSPKKAAAFVCTQTNCSLPIFNPGEIGTFLQAANAHAIAPAN